MQTTPLKNRPVYQVVAGRMAGFFGIQYYDLYYGERDLRSSLEPVVPALQTMVRSAIPEDLNRIISRIGTETGREFDHNIAIDSSCHVAVHEDTITGYLWINRKVIDLTGLYIAELPPGSSFVHNVFVFPEYRRKRVFQYLFRTVCHEMFKAGFHTVSCLVDKANRQSVEAFRNEGIEFHNTGVLKLPGIKSILFCRALA